MAWNTPPQGSTLPELMKGVRIDAPQIGGLVAAIMAQRAREEKLQEEQMDKLIREHDLK